MNRVKDKVAVITGASLGIGHQTAVRLAEEDCRCDLLCKVGPKKAQRLPLPMSMTVPEPIP